MSITRINNLGITDGTIVNADISASAAIASTKLTGVNDAKAWVNFNGTGTVAINGSFNVSSITDSGTGDYAVNFTTAMTDVNYSTVANCSRDASVNQTGIYITNSQNTASTVQINSLSNTLSPIFYDVNTVLVAVFR